MKWISVVLIAALLIQVGYMPCAAEEPVTPKRDEIERSKFKVGMYIEVTYYSEKGKKETSTGYIKAIDDDAIIIGRGFWKERIAYRDILMTSATRTKLILDRKSKAKQGVFIGFAVGATSGVILGFIVGEDKKTTRRSEAFDFDIFPSKEKTAMLFGCGLGVAGAVVGALIGSAIRSGEDRWKKVPFPTHINIQSQHQGGITLSTSFTF